MKIIVDYVSIERLQFWSVIPTQIYHMASDHLKNAFLFVVVVILEINRPSASLFSSYEKSNQYNRDICE